MFTIKKFSKICASKYVLRQIRTSTSIKEQHQNGPVSRPKVFIKDPDILAEGLVSLELRCDIIRAPNQYEFKKMVNIVKEVNGVDAILWNGYGIPPDDLLDAAGPKLKILASCSVGYENLNVPNLKRRGILVTNASGVSSEAVAETAILLVLAAGRRIEEGRRAIVNDKWQQNFNWLLGFELKDSIVGIVGLGEIGTNIAQRLKTFKVKRILYTGYERKSVGDELGAIFVSSLDELLKDSDFVISCVPLKKETELMFNKTTFAQMKKNAVFVNVGRGGVVNHDDLVEALKTNTIFAAGLDVMTPEPLPVDHPLLQLPNCVLTPHIASATINTRIKMVELAAKNILAALDNKPLLTAVE